MADFSTAVAGLDASTTAKFPHVLAIPFPALGHMIPLLDFSYLLASHGMFITILTTPSNAHRLEPLLQRAQSSGLEIRPLYLPLPSCEHIPHGCENTEDIPKTSFPHLIYNFRMLAQPIEQWIEQQASDGQRPPVCIISDFFLGWTQQISVKLGIPRIVFHPTSAFGVSVVNSLWTHMPHLEVETDEERFVMPDLPVQVSFRRTQVSRLARRFQRFDPMWEFIRESMLLNIQSHGTLLNTFYDLDAIHIDHLHKSTGKTFWPVGPILPSTLSDHSKTHITDRGKRATIDESQCLQWLDSRKPSTVLYVCFGSQSFICEAQISGIASGLEGIDYSFIWVIREMSPNTKIVLPEGFEERVKDKGLIIRGWAPQLLILSHASIGGFLTHCGWNSTLESISFGIPMITWPMSADQFSNSLLVVEYLRIGVQLCEGDATVPDGEELKRAVRWVLGRQGEEMKRAREVRVLARRAVEAGGSSSQSLKAFVDEIHNLASPNFTHKV